MLSPVRLAFVATLLIGCGSGADSSGSGGGGTGGSGSGAGNGTTTCVPGTCGATSSCDATEPEHQGEATYYDFADGSGNCSFPATPDDLDVGAMNDTDYAGSAVCGSCASIDGPNGSVTVRIVDRCPECPAGDIDLSPEAFAKIAALEQGRVPITWRYVPCDVGGPIVYHFKEGSNPWWTAVQIRNHRYAIATLEYQGADGAMRTVARESYNFFVEASGMGPGPYTFRVTDDKGQVVEDSGIPFVEAGDSPGHAQFPQCAP